ncbi:tRNA lysidine(34) synthetase TilS [Candidatus Desantisbacteria bacterium]|nr:tRNA lysidine(34) synthetase TilS [Candidatus Desantisbacteria bacterium]
MIPQGVHDVISQYQLLAKKDRIVIGVSGGPDSIALLHILWQLSEEYSLSLRVAHLNHMQRGQESKEDAEYTLKFANELSIPVISEEIDIKTIKEKEAKDRPLTDVARKIRYDFLKRVAKGFNAHKIAVGHHADDLVETVLINLIRGCGPNGLKGITPIRKIDEDLLLIRPLIKISSLQIHQYLSTHHLSFRVDSSNLKSIFLRNRVRLQLLPLLKKEYNPKIENSFIQLSQLIKMDEDYIDEAVNHALLQVVVERKEKMVVMDVASISGLHPAIQTRVIRRIVAMIKGDIEGFNYQHIQGIRQLILSIHPQGRLSLPFFMSAQRDYKQLIIREESIYRLKPLDRYEYLIEVPGTNEIQDLNSTIKTEVVLKETILKDIEYIEKHSPIECRYPVQDTVHPLVLRAYLDYDQISQPLTLRCRKDGDRFQPYGMQGRKKIKDFFIDLKLPMDTRNRIPLLVDKKDNILWVIGLRIGEQVKITSRTQKVLVVSMVNMGCCVRSNPL